MMGELDAEVVELLRRSVEQQGQLLPVIKDQYGNILSGRHRKAADPDWRETTVVVEDELDRELKIVHFNVQRRPSREETAARLLRIAELLEERGVSAENVCSEMAKLVPYSKQYISELLPEKYKRKYVPKEDIASIKKQLSTSLQLPRKTSDTAVVERGSPPKPQTAEQPVECQSCHVRTWFPYVLKDGRVLCSLCFEKGWKKGVFSEDDLKTEVSDVSRESKTTVAEPVEQESKSEEVELANLPKIPVDINAGVIACNECGRKFLLLHVHHPDGRVSHRLEEVKGE